MNWERIKVSGGAMAPPDQKIVQLANHLGLSPELGPSSILRSFWRTVQYVMDIEKNSGDSHDVSKALQEIYDQCEGVLDLGSIGTSDMLDAVLGK
jgi:hypothetical protein